MTDVRSRPCSVCPYRRDVPSGIWHRDEYEKLRDYDQPTWAQPVSSFRCHATPGHHCNGWANVHTARGHEYDLLALRLRWPPNGIPHTSVPFFDSGNEAADHGQTNIEHPTPPAIEASERLARKHHWIGP